MKLYQLVKHLEAKTPELEEDVEFIIVTKEGRIITMDVAETGAMIARALKHFKGVAR